MDEARFLALARRAKLLKSEYGAGYASGLRRHYYGDRYGDAAEHAARERRQDELGRGYRDGLAGCEPEPLRGRPPVEGETRSARVEWRTTPSRKARAEEAAAAAGLTLSAWLDRTVDAA